MDLLHKELMEPIQVLQDDEEDEEEPEPPAVDHHNSIGSAASLHGSPISSDQVGVGRKESFRSEVVYWR